MEYDEHVAVVDREVRALAEALAAGPLDATVPSCPGWTLSDLAQHVGQFTGFYAHVLCEGTGRPKTPYTEPPEGDDRAAWFGEVAGHLLAELRATPPGTEVWTWSPTDKTARFVARRAAHELSVHRFDAQLARDGGRPIDDAVAADGIEEVFAMIDAWGPPAGTGAGERLHLCSTDDAGEWLVTLGAEGLVVERGVADGGLTLEGGVSDLELVLYGRPPLGEVVQSGDPAALEAWYRAFTF